MLSRLAKRRPSSRGQNAATRRRAWKVVELENRIAPAVEMLPDLHVLAANLSDWTLSPNNEVRFSTGMANGGDGAFELNGTTQIINNPDGSQSHVVNQKIYWSDGSTTTKVAGTFTYHPTHGHTHFDDFAIARLRIRPTDQSVGGVVATGPKTSFCLIDINRYDGTLPGSPTGKVYSCTTTKQGISVGWNDVYSSGLDGQSISVVGIPNGDYWLEVEADPENHILEKNETNNVTRRAITIGGQNPVGFRVQTAAPIGAQNNPIDNVALTFNMQVNPATFTSSDVVFEGPDGIIPVTVSSLNNTEFQVNFANQTKVGTYVMTIGPDIRNTSNAQMDQNNNGTGGESQDYYVNIFTITAPGISMVTPAGSTAPPVNTARVTYNRPMTSSTFTLDDVLSFTGPGATNLLGTITSVTPVFTGGQSQAFDIAFTAVTTPGLYTMVFGADVQDSIGNLVDQNNNGIPNEGDDQYTNIFSFPVAGTYGPDAFGYTAVPTTAPSVSMVGATNVTFPHTDDSFVAMKLGTDSFNFYGTTYSGDASTFVTSNGLITFGSSTSAYTNDNLSSLAMPAIAALWDDWIIGSGSPQARYLKRDTNGDLINDQLVVEWNQNYHVNTSSNGVTFFAFLELNTGNRPGKITISYPDITTGSSSYTNGASASVGVRSDTTMNSKLVVSQNSNSHPLVGTGKAMLISTPSVVSIVRGDSSPAPDGDVHYLVTFSDPINSGVDVGDFVLTTSGMTGSEVHGVNGTADPKVWEVHVSTGYGTGTIRMDVVDNDSIISKAGAKLGGAGLGNGSFNTGEVYNIVQQPPGIQGSNIGDGTAQRSRVDRVTVVFTKIVTFAGDPNAAFHLVGPNGVVECDVDLSLTTPVQTVAKLTFDGAGSEYGSLADGNYTLTVLSSQITTGGVALDGDGNGLAGGNHIVTFHRLYGDMNGDKSVAANDFIQFRLVFNGPNAALDFDNDGSVSASDFIQFRLRFGGGL